MSQVNAPSGMQSTTGSQGELSDRQGDAGIPKEGDAQCANGTNSFNTLHQGRESQMGGDRS